MTLSEPACPPPESAALMGDAVVAILKFDCDRAISHGALNEGLLHLAAIA